MKSVEIKNGNLLAFKDLLNGIQRLDLRALEAFAKELNRLIAKRKKQPQSEREAELIRMIKEHIPLSLRHRQKELYHQFQAQTLTEEGRVELELLNNMLEEKSAERIHLMGELAALRKITLPELVQEIDLKLTNE
jgi:hypothetical protein